MTIQGDQGSYDFPSRPLLDRTLFTVVLDKLTRLSSLTLCDVRFENFESGVSKRFAVDELLMSSVGSHRDSPRSIISFLYMFSSIGTLRTHFVDSWYEAALNEGVLNPLKHEFKHGRIVMFTTLSTLQQTVVRSSFF